MSRRLKLVLGLVALQGAAMLVVLGVTYWASQDMLLRFSEDLAARIARDTTAFTDGYLEPANETVEITHRLIEREIFSAESPTALRTYFLELLSERETIDGIYYGDETGAFLFASRAAEDAPGPLRFKRIETAPERAVTLEWYTDRLRRVDQSDDPEDAFDPRTRPWYTEAVAEDAAVWTNPYIFFSSQEPGITVAVPVHNALGSSTVGAVGVDIKITALSAFLETLDISPRGQAAIVSKAGDIIAHSVPDVMSGRDFNTVSDGSDPILAQAAAQIEGGFDTLFPGEIRLARFDADGEVWLGSVLRLELERTPWTVVTYLPESDILEPLHRVRSTAVLVSLLALLATALLGYVYGRRVMG
ncbi:MAG: cache domain-containing protein [Pseudomonadota bacterium]